MDEDSKLKGFDRLADRSRMDARMRKDGEEYSEEQRRALLGELSDYRTTHGSAGKPKPWRDIARLVGLPESTLTEIRKGVYQGDVQKCLRKIDDALADERLRRGRFDDRSFATTSLTRQIWGVIKCGVTNNSMPVIIGAPGSGKSIHARAYAADREGVVLIRVDESTGDARGVTALLCNAITALRPTAGTPFRKRVADIKTYFARHLNTVVVVTCPQFMYQLL